jgi:hypothetical protein
MENAQLNGSATLQARLNEPQTVAALTRLLDRIESLEHTVNTLADLAEQGPGMAGMVGDMADEAVRRAAARGVDVEERLKVALELAEKLTAPEMVTKLDQLLEMADQAPLMAAMVADMADETVRRAAANGIDIEERLRSGLAVAEKLTAPEMTEAFKTLLDPQVVAVLNKTGIALNQSLQKQPEKLGLMGMLRAMGDSDVQQALGFLMGFARHFGQTMR